MKLAIGLIFLFFIVPCSIYAQKCDTLKGSFSGLPYPAKKFINCTDSFGKKQGWWVVANDGTPLSEGYIDIGYYWVGQYLNNKKYGKWEEVEKDGCTIGISQEIEYKDDGSVIVSTLDGYMKTYYNADSSVVKSEYTTRSGSPKEDIIKIECLNKGNCIVKYENHILKTFPYASLEFELYKVSSLGYKPDVQNIKRKEGIFD